MNYAEIKYVDVANGPGCRVNLFVSGCSHHCKGCFNQETWDYNYGSEFSEREERIIMNRLNHDYIKGFTVLGGEPMDPRNISTIANLCKKIKDVYPNKDIWIYTGYTFEQLTKMYDYGTPQHAYFDLLLHTIDVIVDGEFVEALSDLKLRFRGSSNQRFIDVKETKIRLTDEVDGFKKYVIDDLKFLNV